MSKHVAVIGGSVAGLGVGLALAQNGHRVTILEKDATPLPPTPLEAFESWDRRGSPQVRHSHAFLARLTGILRDCAPDLYALLLEHGAEELRFADMARRTFDAPELEPEDAQLVLLACRRVTFEWVLRRYVLDTGLVEFGHGIEVTGLAAERDVATGLPRVCGARLRTADGARVTLPADLVLDASGRRSKLPHWLREIGADALEDESEACGIFYSSRFYALREGAETPELGGGGVAGGDLGYMKYGVFPGDNGIFSITLCASPDDAPLRVLLRTHGFEAAAAALPATREWVDPDRSRPITDVHGMGNLHNTRRFFVKEGSPLALGLFPVGDALIHTNPLNGRGCTLAFVNAWLVADALEKHPDDPLAFAREVDSGVAAEIVPWYEATRSQDRDAIEVNLAQQRGEDPFAYELPDGSVDPRKWMRTLLREGLLPAMREDLGLLRAFMRAFNLLEAPQDLMRKPELMQAVLASFNRRHEREPTVQGPTRSEMLEELERATAAAA